MSRCLPCSLACSLLLASCHLLFDFQHEKATADSGLADARADGGSVVDLGSGDGEMKDSRLEDASPPDAPRSWSEVTQAGRALSDIWGASNTDLFMVGLDGKIFRFRGAPPPLELPSNTTATLKAVWGTSASNVYAVGEDSTILHYDGASWSPISVAMGVVPLHDIWGSSADDIYVVGKNGVILHCCSDGWKLIRKSTDETLRGVGGTSSSSVLVVGGLNTPVALFFDGNDWTEVSPPLEMYYRVWGMADSIYVCGTGLARFDLATNTWELLSSSAYPLFAVWGTAVGDVVAVGDNSSFAYYDGTDYFGSRIDALDIERWGIWAGPSGPYFAVGTDGKLMQYVP